MSDALIRELMGHVRSDIAALRDDLGDLRDKTDATGTILAGEIQRADGSRRAHASRLDDIGERLDGLEDRMSGLLDDRRARKAMLWVVSSAGGIAALALTFWRDVSALFVWK